MRLTRREDISLYLYIKDTIIAPRYSEISSGMALSQVSTNKWEIEYDDFDQKFPFRRGEQSGLGRGILYFDYVGETALFGTEQTNIVKIYSTSGTVHNYKVNYIDGTVESSQDLSAFSIDYEWNYVSVVDAFPYEVVPSAPVVSLELLKGNSSGLQLGGGQIRHASWGLHIFASNAGERDDLTDLLYDNIYMRRCPLYTLVSGLPLLYNGTFNSNFLADIDPDNSSLYFDNVGKTLTGLPQWGFYEQETINKFRSMLTFTTDTYCN